MLLAKSPRTKTARRPEAKLDLVKRALVKTARHVVPARVSRLLPRHGVMMTVGREQVLVVRARAQVVRGLVRQAKVARRAKVGLVIALLVVRFGVPAVRGWAPA